MPITYGESWGELCSRALEKLGAGSVSSLSGGSRNASLCNLYLGTAISNVIGPLDWHALRTRLQIAPSSTTPVYGFDYAYPLPSNFERLIEVETNGDSYSFENGNILTDGTEVYITYIARPTDDPSKLPSTLKDLIACELAVLLAKPLSASESRISAIMIDREQARKAAIANDARLNMETVGEAVRGFGYYDELR